MASRTPFNYPRFQAFDGKGKPLEGGTAEFFVAGTTTPKSVFSDTDLTVIAPNPVTLNARGEPESGGGTPIDIYLDGQPYKIVLKDSDGNTVWTVDNFFIGKNADEIDITDSDNNYASSDVEGALSEIDNVKIVDSVSDLQSGSYESGIERIWLSGYYGVGTSGGGPLYRDSADTTTADNGGTVFVDADGVRWKRHVGEGPIYVTWFGAKGDQPDDGSGFDSQPAFQAAHDYVHGIDSESLGNLRSSNNAKIVVPRNPTKDGYYYLGSRVAGQGDSSGLDTGIEWVGEAGGGNQGFLTRIAKAGDDFAFYAPFSRWAWRDMIIQGQGPNDPANNDGTTENFPAILALSSSEIDNIMVERCGGPNYGSKRQTETGVDHSKSTGRVPMFIDAHGTHSAGDPSCFGIGLLADNALGNGDVNTCRVKNVFGNSIFGDIVYYASVTNSDANASYIHIRDMRNVIGAAIGHNSGWSNKFEIQEAIVVEAAIRYSARRDAGTPGQILNNKLEVAYSDDAIQRGVYFDLRDGSGGSVGSDLFIANEAHFQRPSAITGQPDTVITGSHSGFLDQNFVTFPVVSDQFGTYESLVVGMGAPANRAKLVEDFVPADSPIDRDVVTDVIGSFYSASLSDLNNARYIVTIKMYETGIRNFDAWARYLFDFRAGALQGSAELNNVAGADSRTISVSGTTLTFSFSTDNTSVAINAEKVGFGD